MNSEIQTLKDLIALNDSQTITGPLQKRRLIKEMKDSYNRAIKELSTYNRINDHLKPNKDYTKELQKKFMQDKNLAEEILKDYNERYKSSSTK